MIKRRYRERLRSDRKRYVQAVPEGQDDIDRHRLTVVRATNDVMAVARASPPPTVQAGSRRRLYSRDDSARFEKV